MPRSSFFFFNRAWSQTQKQKKTPNQTHPCPEKLLCVKFYWGKPHQETKLCGTQRAWFEITSDKHLSRVYTPAATRLVLNTSLKYAWSNSSSSDWKFTCGFVCSIQDYPGDDRSAHGSGLLKEGGEVWLPGTRKLLESRHTEISCGWKTRSPSKGSYYVFMYVQYGKYWLHFKFLMCTMFTEFLIFARRELPGNVAARTPRNTQSHFSQLQWTGWCTLRKSDCF